MNAASMAVFSGLNRKADEAGFLVVYPNGQGWRDMLLFWNVAAAGGRQNKDQADNVAFIARVLDDLPKLVNVDRRRVYATGMSIGGTMCYLLAAELSDRIAAIAPVAGTMAVGKSRPRRPVPVMHFHGTDDKLVPYHVVPGPAQELLGLQSVKATIGAWAEIDGCPARPVVTDLPDRDDDGTRVTREVYGPGKDESEVVLWSIEGGGHTWPGRQPMVGWIGKSTTDISANDRMWEFFQRHPMPDAGR